MIQKLLLGAAASLLLLLAILMLRTAQLDAQDALAPPISRIELDDMALAERLARAIRIPTITRPETPIDPSAFAELHGLLAAQFPRVHAQLAVERVGDFSLLYRWDGRDRTLKPALFAAHQDVVPVEPGTEPRWTHPPFSGAIADGHVWGRGTLDDKSSLIAQLEAVEYLLAQGFRPQRTLYFAYGHDEETGGAAGAAQIARLLGARGVRFAFTLDEGSAITQGIIAGIDRPVAAIMVGEKGYVTFRLTARGRGGHASTPSAEAAIPRLARALARLDARPLPARLTEPVADMLARLAPYMPYPQRLVIANRDVFEPLLLRALARNDITHALIRTTQAMTVLRAGVKDNVLPTQAEALINYRLLPGERIEALRQHIIATIADASIDVTLAEGFGNEAPPPSDADAPEFALIAKTVTEVFPQALVTSGIILATTDNRHYAAIRDQGYYFVPLRYTPQEQTRIHGTDERIAITDYADMVRFYVRLFENAGG
ncbi:carboxypeptidase PM20D1 [Fontimonas thermophila]|uniref:Carboxypeptidase PM20D1 n=1 Tax=Fontimonas thermophila TaxID=1076937 RepID=A0A1I2H3G3_9GAMM|nr:M20 family peptidase [Fontimonas thermophila]SFF23869.1 carboxypeptidase PM20D1 [Fontimonas thermophila]